MIKYDTVLRTEMSLTLKLCIWQKNTGVKSALEFDFDRYTTSSLVYISTIMNISSFFSIFIKKKYKYTKTALKHVWPVFFQGYHTFSLYMGSTDPKNHSGPLPLNWYRKNGWLMDYKASFLITCPRNFICRVSITCRSSFSTPIRLSTSSFVTLSTYETRSMRR